jgi:hypothetical protein
MVFFRRAASSAHIDKDVAGVKMFHAFLLQTEYFCQYEFPSRIWLPGSIAGNDGIQEEVLAL